MANYTPLEIELLEHHLMRRSVLGRLTAIVTPRFEATPHFREEQTGEAPSWSENEFVDLFRS